MNRRKYSLLRKPHRQHRPASGFTIVELLVVIVVIGILAAITIVSYTGISQKAVLASLQSDLSTSAQKLKMYQVEHGAYPAALDGSNYPTGPADAHYCLKPSPGNRFVYGSSSPYSTFSLTATNDNGTSYQVTDNSQPTALAAAPLSPVADWLATAQGDHYGNYYDLVSHGWATVTRSTPKTIYDPNDGRIHDVPAGYLAMNPWNAYQSGGRGSAAVVEEARTNYLLNSYGAAHGWVSGIVGEPWTTGWVIPTDVIGTPVCSLVQGIYGTTAMRIQYTGVAGDNGKYLYIAQNTATGTFAEGESAQASFWVKATHSGVNALAIIDARASNNGALGNTIVNVASNGVWTRLSDVYSGLPASTSKTDLMVYFDGIHEGDTIDITIDAAQLEKGSFATSYIPTTTAAATRNADMVTVPTTGWNAAAGTIVAVAGPAGGMNYASMLGAPDGSSYMRRSASDSVVALVRGDAYANHYSAPLTGADVVAGTWVLGTGTDSVITYYNGNASAATTGALSAPAWPENMYIGQAWAAFWDGPIQRAIVYSSALSSSDVTTVTNAIKNGP